MAKRLPDGVFHRKLKALANQKAEEAKRLASNPCPRAAKTSPQIDPKEIAGKTPAEIDAIAKEKGLIPKGPDPMNGKGAYVDPVTGEQRVLSHPDDGHAHVNDPTGNRLDINGNPVDPNLPGAHLPIGK